jgi:hypothetical protein
MSNTWHFDLGVPMAVLAAATLALGACGGGGSDDDGGGGSGGGGGSAVTTEQAEVAVAEAISTALDSNANAVTMLALSSQAVDAIATAAGIMVDDGSGGGGDDLNISDQLGPALGLVFNMKDGSSRGVRVGDTVTYDPDETELCLSPLFAALAGDPDGCEAFYSNVTAKLNIDSEADGTLAFMYENATLLTIGYAPDTAYVELGLDEVGDVFDIIVNQGRPSGLPGTLEGRARLTAESLGPDSGRITFSIEEAINIIDTENDIDLQFPATSEALTLTLDAPNNSAEIKLGLGGFDATSRAVDLSGTNREALVMFDGLSLLFSLENNGDDLVGSEIGLGDNGFVIDVVGDLPSDDPVDFSVQLPDFSYVVDGTNGTLTFTSAVDFSFALDDRYGLFEPTYTPGLAHSFDLDIAANTQLLPIADPVSQMSVFLVNAGTVTATGTGDFAGNAVATVGQCFTLDPNGLLVAPAFFPMALVDCP